MNGRSIIKRVALLPYDFVERTLIGENDESEAARPIGVSVIDDFHGLNLSKILEVGFEGVFVRISRASDEQLPILFVSHCFFFFQTGMFF